MSNRVHPSVEWMQPAGVQPMTDDPTADPQTGELNAGDHAVLAFRERGKGTIDFVRPQFGPYDGLNCGFVGHGPMVARKPLRRTA